MMNIYGRSLNSRLFLGTAAYPSPEILIQAIQQAKVELITVSLRREGKAGQGFRDILKQLNINVLPNTAGCYSVKEAVTTAHMAREVFNTAWIKLEVIGHPDTLQPNPFALLEAAKILSEDGFQVFPYMTEDLVLAEKLLYAGCEVLMPWGAPIGSGQGLKNIESLQRLRHYFPDTPLIIDAGIGVPSHAAQAMELGFDAILLNTAVAQAQNPVHMAEAFRLAIEAGHLAYGAGLIPARTMAHASTPFLGLADLS
jgi:thiazole synthase